MAERDHVHWAGEHNRVDELDGLNLATADLDDIAEALRKLEGEKQRLLEATRMLRLRFSDEKADQGDVYYFLHKKLDDNYDVISSLERQLMIETADREKAETAFARKIDELECLRDEELVPLRERLITAEEQLNSMQDAAETKRESDATKARLEEELRSTQTSMEDDLTIERRKKLQEKQRVRRQVEYQLRDLSNELLSQKEVELADKTVRAAVNNEKLQLALQAKAKQAERMVVVNQGLAFENASLRNDVDVAQVSEVVLGKRVRLYHDIVMGLKAQLEQEATVDEDDEQELAGLEESLANGKKGVDASGALETISLLSEATSAEQVVWAGGACGGLVYESADELRVAVDSLQRLHLELQEKVKEISAQADQVRTETAASRQEDKDPLTAFLLRTVEEWIAENAAECMPIEAGKTSTRGSLTTAANNKGLYNFALSKPHARSRSETSTATVYTAKTEHFERRDNRQQAMALGEKKGGIVSDRMISSTSSDRHGQRYKGKLGQEQRLAQVVISHGSHEESGPLAAATTTSGRRREVFYALVNAFRAYQDNRAKLMRGDHNHAAMQAADDRDKGKNVDHKDQPTEYLESLGSGIFDESKEITPKILGAENGSDKNDKPAAGSIDLPAIDVHGACEGTTVSSTTAPFKGHASTSGGERDGANRYPGRQSTSDLSSVSARTFDFGIREVRNASTQTVAKHSPEKFASVRLARKLSVSRTFLTLKNSVSTSAGSAHAGGGGSLSSPSVCSQISLRD